VRTIRVLRNISTNYLRMAVSVVVGIVLTPIMVHTLGDSGYGLWVTIFSLTGYFGLMDQGIRPSLVRYVSQHHTQGDTEALSRTLSSAATLYGSVGLLTLLATFVVAANFGTWFRIGPEHVDVARHVVMVSGLSLAVGFPLGVFGATLSGLQRYDIANAIGIGISLLRVAAFVVVLRMGGQLVELAWCSLALNLLGHGLSMLFVFRLLPRVRFLPRFVDRSTLERIGSYSGFAFVGALATTITFQTDALVITAFMGAAAVTPFALAASLVNQCRQLVYAATWVLSPTASELETRGELGKLQAMLMLGSKYGVLVSWPVLIALVIFGPNVLTTWVGARYADSSRLITILAVPTLFALPQSAASSVLFGISRHRGVVALSLANAVINLGLSLLWVRPFGLDGVAWGTAVPLFTVAGLGMIVFGARKLQLPLGVYLWEGLVRPGLVSLTFVPPALLVQWLWHPVGWVPLIAACVGCWLVFAAVAWRWGQTDTERTRWKEAVPRMLGFGAAPAGSGR
jgi:O-antigen/teichoic acid export membrane protein